jgi:chromosome partitioning protein
VRALMNTVVCLNGKGGVLKTSLVAQLSGLAAAGGWRCLAVDLDPQGNLAVDLGVPTDGGEALANAVASGEPLEPKAGVRPRLDLVTAGPATARLGDQLRLDRINHPLATVPARLHRVLAPVAPAYDLVVIDCPPGDRVLHAEALTAGRWLLIPTQPDTASINGLAATFAAWLEAKAGPNPDLELLGIVLGPMATTATGVRADAEALLHRLVGDQVHVFPQAIRQAQAPAANARKLGLLVHELVELKKRSPRWYELAKEERAAYRMADGRGLASDYAELTRQILGRLGERRR